MKATYRISEDNYVEAMKLFMRLTPWTAAFYLASMAALVVLAVFGTPILRGGAIGGLIGGCSVTLIGRYIVSPMLARRHYRKYKAIHEEFAVDLIDGGIRLTSPSAEAEIAWDKIHKWRENDKYVLVYLMPRLFNIVPKSVAAHGFDIQALEDALRQHVGKPT